MGVGGLGIGNGGPPRGSHRRTTTPGAANPGGHLDGGDRPGGEDREPDPWSSRPASLDEVELREIIAPGGRLATVFPRFEDRPSQRDMLEEVAKCYNEGGVSIVEAGTGTGKSLAYLIPAIRWAEDNAGTTVVSTNTINLQEQLASKDIPLAQALIGKVRWALIKGRNNYVSIRRAHLAAEDSHTLFSDERKQQLLDIARWAKATEDGSRGDLEFAPRPEVWEEVKSDGDVCLRSKCRFFEKCHYQRARRQAIAAKVLVVNHALLFTDISVRRASDDWQGTAVLPPFSRLIIDEAHNVEDVATAHLGFEVSGLGLQRALARLDSRGRGVLTTIHEALREVDWGRELRERVENQVRPALAEARSGLERFLSLVSELIERTHSGGGATSGVRTSSGSGTQDSVGGPIRLGPRGIGEPAENEGAFREALDSATARLDLLRRRLGELRQRIEDRTGTGEDHGADPGGAVIPPDRLAERALDLRHVENRIEAAVTGLTLIFSPSGESPDFVRWLETRGRRGQGVPVMCAAPLEPGGLLAESLFSRIDSAVLTSATLTTGGGFSYMRDRLGLGEVQLELASPDNPPEVRELVVPSPFDYGRQAMIGVPTDLARADSRSRDFLLDTARVIRDLSDITGGGILVLFTAHSALRAVAHILRSGKRWDLPLFVQGEAQRAQLLARFASAGNGVLLGTASFWEGVDVPGRALRALVVHKLPFTPPSDPVTRARAEAMEKAGIDPFRALSLPRAALRLKQGIGRLIRSNSDRGAIVILDDRIVRMRYGRYLKHSLPPAPMVRAPWRRVRAELREFYPDGGTDPRPHP